MPNSYRPETPRPGTEELTNNRNTQQTYAILNRLADKIDSIENNVTIISGGSVSLGELNDVAEFAFMMGIE